MFVKARSPKNNTYSMGKLDHLFGTVFLPHKGQYGSQVLLTEFDYYAVNWANAMTM